MPGILGAVSLFAFMAAVLCGILLLVTGIVAIKRHPAIDDPARNAKRYTRPALFFAVGSVLAMVVGVFCALVACALILWP